MALFGTNINYHLVEYFLIGLFIFYVLFEVYLNLNQDKNDTTNVLMLAWSKDKFFFIPFALGAIIGHLFLGTSIDILAPLNLSELWHSIFPVVVLFITSGIMLFVGYKITFIKTKLFLTSLLFAGIAYGHLFWTMNISKAAL